MLPGGHRLELLLGRLPRTERLALGQRPGPGLRDAHAPRHRKDLEAAGAADEGRPNAVPVRAQEAALAADDLHAAQGGELLARKLGGALLPPDGAEESVGKHPRKHRGVGVLHVAEQLPHGSVGRHVEAARREVRDLAPLVAAGVAPELPGPAQALAARQDLAHAGALLLGGRAGPRVRLRLPGRVDDRRLPPRLRLAGRVDGRRLLLPRGALWRGAPGRFHLKQRRVVAVVARQGVLAALGVAAGVRLDLMDGSATRAAPLRCEAHSAKEQRPTHGCGNPCCLCEVWGLVPAAPSQSHP
mmetsp:Transcript_45629/g.141045  ORF Transcript_45629/g.141045 Transcript_45629/m.141045 type:complete len:300 (+) Transcript_45629:971-1870(+)